MTHRFHRKKARDTRSTQWASHRVTRQAEKRAVGLRAPDNQTISEDQTGFHARRLGQQRCDVHWRRRQSPGAKIAETANAKLHASAKRSSGKRLTQICHKSAYQQFHRRWPEQRAQLVTSCSGGDLYRAAPLRYPRRYRYDIRGENKWGGTFGQRLWTLGEPWC